MLVSVRAEQQEQRCIVQQCRAATEVGSLDSRAVGSHMKVSFPLQIDSITDRCSGFSIRLGVPSRWRA